MPHSEAMFELMMERVVVCAREELQRLIDEFEHRKDQGTNLPLFVVLQLLNYYCTTLHDVGEGRRMELFGRRSV
jgi:hypothetical protein